MEILELKIALNIEKDHEKVHGFYVFLHISSLT